MHGRTWPRFSDKQNGALEQRATIDQAIPVVYPTLEMVQEKKQTYDCRIKKLLDEQRIPIDEVTQLIGELKEVLPVHTREIDPEAKVEMNEVTAPSDDGADEETDNPEFECSETREGRKNRNECYELSARVRV